MFLAVAANYQHLLVCRLTWPDVLRLVHTTDNYVAKEDLFSAMSALVFTELVLEVIN